MIHVIALRDGQSILGHLSLLHRFYAQIRYVVLAAADN